jgi:hypothetical protein
VLLLAMAVLVYVNIERAAAFGGAAVRPVLAGSSPTTWTFECQVKPVLQPLGSSSATPEPDTLQPLSRMKTVRSTRTYANQSDRNRGDSRERLAV